MFKKKLSFFKLTVRYLWRCSSRESHAQLVVLLWAVFGSSRESHAIVLQIPTTKKSLLGKAQKVIGQKAHFSLEKCEKNVHFSSTNLIGKIG